MKTKLFALFGLIVIIISATLIYLQTKQTEVSFKIDSLDLSDWTKNDNALPFWFPKNDITIVKKIENSYLLDYTTKVETPLNLESVNAITSYQPISKIRQELVTQGFSQLSDTSGLFANNDNSINPYFIETYQKDNTICQLNLIFECLDKKCVLSSPRFGCANFDLDVAYQEQSQYYQLHSDNSEYYSDHSIAIINVDKNPEGFLSVNSGSWSDGILTFFNKENEIVCNGLPCCDQSSKSQFSDVWGDWCTDDYQTIETYQPVGL